MPPRSSSDTAELLALASFLMRGSTYERGGVEYVSEFHLSVHDRDLIVKALRALAQAAPHPIMVSECRILIKRIDDLLHGGDAKAGHVELHELAYAFEQVVSRDTQK